MRSDEIEEKRPKREDAKERDSGETAAKRARRDSAASDDKTAESPGVLLSFLVLIAQNSVDTSVLLVLLSFLPCGLEQGQTLLMCQDSFLRYSWYKAGHKCISLSALFQ